MNGPIAQVVALTGHGNTYLREHKVPTFFPANSTCKFCDKVAFVVVERTIFGRTKEKPIAATPDEWFSYLRSLKAHGIRVRYTPHNDPGFSDRMSAGFVRGGGTWSMEIILPKGRRDSWIARWGVWNQEAPEDRVWRVTYGRVSTAGASAAPVVDLTQSSENLATSLRDIHKFSKDHDCGGFTQCFKEALDTIDSSGKVLHGHHQDLIPDSVSSREAKTILDACQRCWVFGGMGSWNDMGFDGDVQNVYEEVSERLFEAATDAIVAAANTTCAGPETIK